MPSVAEQLHQAEYALARAKTHSFLASRRSAHVIKEYMEGLLTGREGAVALADALESSKLARALVFNAAQEVARLRKLLENS